jgi:hypothetical protein
MEVFQSFQYDDRYSQLLTLCNLIQTQASLSSSIEPIAVLIALGFARWHPRCAIGTVSGLVVNGLSYVHKHEKWCQSAMDTSIFQREEEGYATTQLNPNRTR